MCVCVTLQTVLPEDDELEPNLANGVSSACTTHTEVLAHTVMYMVTMVT